MGESKAAALLRELIQKTSEKKLRWHETAIPDTFLVAMGGKYTVTLFGHTANPDEEDELADVLWKGPPSFRLKEGDEVLLDVTARDEVI